jgi:hypothetical protein
MSDDEQLTFDLEEGRRRRDEAMDHVNNPPWRSFAERALRQVARRQASVTSDDVWAELDRMEIPRPAEGRAMGPVMMAGVKEGLIVPSGYASGRNPKHHADVMRVYRSAFFD